MNRYKKIVILSTLIIYCTIFIPAVSAILTSDISLPFHQNLDISGTWEYRITNQETAPLDIKFKVNPEMITDVKYIMPKSSSTKGYNQTVTYPSPNSWFQITITNSKTSEVLATKGYGRTFDQSNGTTAFPVLLNGPYKVLIEGGSCTVDLSIQGSGTGNEYSPTPSPISSKPPTTQQIVNTIPTVIPSSKGNSNTTSPIIFVLVLLLLAGGGYGIYRIVKKPTVSQTPKVEIKDLIIEQPQPLSPSLEYGVFIPPNDLAENVQPKAASPATESEIIRRETPRPTAKPKLTLTLDHTQLNANNWDKMTIQLVNHGNASAKTVRLTFSDEFDTKWIKPVTIDAGETISLDIAIRPKIKGKIPLDITALFCDDTDKEYRERYEFWIEVIENITTPPSNTPHSPVGQFTPKPLTPKQLPPDLSDKYTESEFIGKGGFARVFKAKRKDGKYVAVKIPISMDAVTGKSFIAEMQNWTKLSHPNIVRLYDYNIMPMPYFEEELCDSALADQTKPIESEEAALILFNICEGLKFAHKQKIIHRDLKPQNILLKNGVPKISDWGLSRIISSATTTTTTSFTAYYAAPEQIGNKIKDERTDIWQLGVILYELATGVLPFRGESMMEIGMNIALKDPIPPGELKPDAKVIDAVVMKCLEKDPKKRYPSVLELQKDLATYLRKNYTELLKTSVSVQDYTKSAYYCGDLVMVNFLTGDMKSAYKYLLDLTHYSEGDVKVEAQELSEQIRMRMDMGVTEIPDELIQKAEIIVHQVSVGFRNKG